MCSRPMPHATNSTVAEPVPFIATERAPIRHAFMPLVLTDPLFDDEAGAALF